MRAVIMMSVMIVVEIKSSQSRLEFFVFTQVSPKTLCDPSLVVVGESGRCQQHVGLYCGAIGGTAFLTFPEGEFESYQEVFCGFSFPPVEAFDVVETRALKILLFATETLFKSPNQV